MAYEKYWMDIERKAGRVNSVGFPIKWFDSRIELETIDIDLNNKYEYFEFYGIKYNRNEYIKRKRDEFWKRLESLEEKADQEILLSKHEIQKQYRIKINNHK